ncbi:MAG: GntR family transcriptional regulator [Sphingomonadales bacterium]
MSKANDTAYSLILAGILDGSLVPGSQLKEQELAELCGVSRTPVREALRRLESEMLVMRSSTQRTYVTQWSLHDIREMFMLRAMLEGYGAARAAEHISDDQFDRLKTCNEALGKAIFADDKVDVKEFLRHNREFHSIIVDASGSDRLKMLLTRLVEQPIVHRTAMGYDRTNLSRSHDEHGELIGAISKRDPEWARTIMSGHIHRAYYVYEENYLRQHKGSQNKGTTA